MRIVCKNKKALRDYEVIETFEAGIALVGSEVKSLRAGRVSLKDSYAKVKDGELWLYNMHISPYEKSAAYSPEPKRKRKLLMHKKEIVRLKSLTEERGYTIVPLEIYFNDRGIAKVKIAVVKGRKKYEKKQYLIQKQLEREKERELRDYLRRKG